MHFIKRIHFPRVNLSTLFFFFKRQDSGVDYIDESEVLTPADEQHHINKHNFKIPFVCGARNLGEALRRISEGAAMIRTKGEAAMGNIVEVCAR